MEEGKGSKDAYVTSKSEANNKFVYRIVVKVEYEKDVQWMTWREEALRRFLTKQNMQTKVDEIVFKREAPPLRQQDSKPMRLPTRIPKDPNLSPAWWHPPDNSIDPLAFSFLDGTSEEMLNSDAIIGACTTMVALEDDMWEMTNVSDRGGANVCKESGSPNKLFVVGLQIPLPVTPFNTKVRHLILSCGQYASEKLTRICPRQHLSTCLLLQEAHTICSAKAAQAEKCMAKEVNRQQVLAKELPLALGDTHRMKAATLEKSKQAAITTMMKPVTSKHKAKKATKKTSALGLGKCKKQVESRKPKGKRVPAKALQDITNKEQLDHKVATVHLCGCRHGDLDALKSFTKTEVAYYTRPNRFLEGKKCLTCSQTVMDMKATKNNKWAVVFYCD